MARSLADIETSCKGPFASSLKRRKSAKEETREEKSIRAGTQRSILHLCLRVVLTSRHL